ncbi:MAG TPA: sensor histidine kinase [Brevibacterium senegalense]|uniref:histidine kinase n=1 Tax=Brevibacterium senegalense TaxID=1033736 RepID=A0A921MEE1_9MICO|nr:sensor histidine kinase [Brevibacterium senegalense]
MRAPASRRLFWDGSLARRLFILQLALIVALCLAFSVVIYSRSVTASYEATSDRVLAIAETIARTPFVAEAAQTPDPTARLQPYASNLLDTTDVDFITIMDRDRTRFTHPDPAQLGEPYIGSIDTALTGTSQVEQYTGTLGPSVRAIVPVFDGSTVVAMVAVGVTLETLSVAQAASLPQIAVIASLAILAGGLGSWWLSRYLRRATLGYGPEHLKRLFAFYNSALHSLREGLVLIDGSGRILLYNDVAATLLGLPAASGGQPVSLDEVELPDSVRTLLASGRDAVDEVHLTRDRVLVLNQSKADHPNDGRSPDSAVEGAVATIRDHTDIQELTGELETMRTLSEALRAQTHEHANRMHTLASLIERGRDSEALAFAVQDRQDSQRLTDTFVDSLDEPFITALMIGKAAQAHERGIELTLTASGRVPPGSLDARDLVTVAGNLLDNAFDAATGSDERRVWADFTAADGELIMTIADSGHGFDDEAVESIFHLGVTEKSGSEDRLGRGYGLVLVRQAVARLGGDLRVESDGGAIFTVTLPLTDGGTDAHGTD